MKSYAVKYRTQYNPLTELVAVTATALLVYTKGFTAFDNAKATGLLLWCGALQQNFGKPL